MEPSNLPTSAHLLGIPISLLLSRKFHPMYQLARACLIFMLALSHVVTLFLSRVKPLNPFHVFLSQLSPTLLPYSPPPTRCGSPAKPLSSARLPSQALVLSLACRCLSLFSKAHSMWLLSSRRGTQPRRIFAPHVPVLPLLSHALIAQLE